MDIDSLTQHQFMTVAEFEERGRKSRERLVKSGLAHYVVRDITWLPWVVNHINARLALGERPSTTPSHPVIVS